MKIAKVRFPLIEGPEDIEDVYKAFPDLIPQKVNLNGSSKDHLLAQYREILSTLRVLQLQMGNASPHGRDYVTHSDGFAGTKARVAWSARRVFLRELEKDIEHAAIMVNGQ